MCCPLFPPTLSLLPRIPLVWGPFGKELGAQFPVTVASLSGFPPHIPGYTTKALSHSKALTLAVGKASLGWFNTVLDCIDTVEHYKALVVFGTILAL
ncbi:hypothetical protein R3P38DRAFT_3230511 [Favolaschia claudopus]|uniref:Uncharacterized protein n=1 Tax=Favolaschia claudopus TaxID=2862362 RepID=A0AAV9ZM26_9AGAR